MTTYEQFNLQVIFAIYSPKPLHLHKEILCVSFYIFLYTFSVYTRVVSAIFTALTLGLLMSHICGVSKMFGSCSIKCSEFLD
jgi:hypothetical protein